MKPIQKSTLPLPKPAFWRERFLAQEKVLVDAITKLAEAVSALEPDPAYGRSPMTVIVGGYVRDLLLGKHPKDADVEVYGVHPDKLEKLAKKLFRHVDVVGKSFGILKVFLDNGYELDLAIPRREAKTGAGHKGFAIESDPGLDFREAARRRDFTINAMAMDPLTGVVHDPYNGMTDMQSMTLRVVDPKTFQEDPLRVYRGVQLSARLRFKIEEKTFKLMREMAVRGDLDELSAERITDEWKKLLLKSTRPSLGLRIMRDLGVIDKYYPELNALMNTPQEPEWHPEGDVWIHTGMVIDQAAALIRQTKRKLTREQALMVMLGALCHDFGKPLTTREIDGRIRSMGHEEAGEVPARSFCQRFPFGRDTEDVVVKITKDHLKTTQYWRLLQKGEVSEQQYANMLRRLLRRLDPVPCEVFLTVTEADKRGRGFPNATTEPYPEGDHFRLALRLYDLVEQAKKPLVSGGELIEKFDLEPGPKVGALVKALEDARDDGKITTKEEALAYAKDLL